MKYEDITALKFAAVVTAIAVAWKHVWGILRYLFTLQERSKKLDEIHAEIVSNGGITARLDALTPRVTHVEQMVDMIYDQKEDPVFLCRSDGYKVYVNQAYAKIMEKDSKQLLGHGWQHYVDKADQYIERFKAGTNVRMQIETRDGLYTTVATPITLRDGSKGYFGQLQKSNK